MIERFHNLVSKRAILLLLIVAFLAVSLIGVVSMTMSVVVAEMVQGSGSAINVAGSLRRLTHRIGALVVAEHLNGSIGREEVEDAVAQFESAFAHDDLVSVLQRKHSSTSAAIYRKVTHTWETELRPDIFRLIDSNARSTEEKPSAQQYEMLLAEIDNFVEQLNGLVAELAYDAEGNIEQLRFILAIALMLTLAVVATAMYVLHRRVFQPLTDLSHVAGRIAQRDFAARSRFTGSDELGRVGKAFNAMADELASSYRDLERRVQEKTRDLRRSNRSLELLYHVIARLYHAPSSAESYSETLRDIEQTLDLQGSFACVESKHGEPANILGASIPHCHNGEPGARQQCLECTARPPWEYHREGAHDILMVPLRDAENLYGMIRLALRPGQRLEEWQKVLVEAVSRHMGVALGISQQTERERLLALQEERSIIARELHDSLAQALSYMKIQVSLLTPLLNRPDRKIEARSIVYELREGINSAYRQLRELLSSFRLRMEGDFSALLSKTTEEFAARSGMTVDLDMRLRGCRLTPNQEIHALHIIREALSNATRHSGGDHIDVSLTADPNDQVTIMVEDNGRGIEPHAMTTSAHHYGLTIMSERTRGLGGQLLVERIEQGGTRVVVSFNARLSEEPSQIIDIASFPV